MLTRLIVSALFLLLFAGGAYFILQTAMQLGSPGFGNSLRGFWRTRLIRPLVNPLRRGFGLPPVCVLPLGPDGETVRHWMIQAQALVRQSRDTLSHLVPVSPSGKAELRRQMDNVLENLEALSWKLARLRDLQQALLDNPDYQREVGRMAAELLREMESAFHALQGIPVALLKLELAEEQPEVEKLAEEMRESNQRMRDLIQAHQRVYQDHARYGE